MILDLGRCEEILLELPYEIDGRQPPDDLRMRNFKMGLEDRTLRGKRYKEATLRELTWQNLGYRLGKKFGATTETGIREMYKAFARHFEIKRKT